MPIKAVQQFMLGTVLNNEQQAKETLAAMKAAGYDGIELCGFMIHPIGFVVKLLTKAAGMPVGKGGNLDWHKLVQEAGLKVVSLHTDLGSLERDAHAVAEEAKSFGTEYVVITGMYRFDYGDEATMHELAKGGRNPAKRGHPPALPQPQLRAASCERSRARLRYSFRGDRSGLRQL